MVIAKKRREHHAGHSQVLRGVVQETRSQSRNELIDWFNQMDATYRADLKELNELNFARFDAKLEQRISELRSELHQEIARLETRLVRWMFLFWVGTLGTMVALFRFWAG